MLVINNGLTQSFCLVSVVQILKYHKSIDWSHGNESNPQMCCDDLDDDGIYNTNWVHHSISRLSAKQAPQSFM